METGISDPSILLTFREQKLQLLSTLDIHAFFGDPKASYEVEDLSSLSYLVLGPKGVSSLKAIQYQKVNAWYSIQTADGFSIGLGKDQLLAVINDTGRVEFVAAKDVTPGMTLLGFDGRITSPPEQNHFDVLSQFLTELPLDTLETLEVTGIREYLASIEDNEKNEVDFPSKFSQLNNELPNHLSLQVFKQLVATYGIYDNEISNIRITSKESHTMLSAQLPLSNQLHALIGLFLRAGHYDDDGHPYLIVPIQWKQWTVNLIQATLHTSTMIFPSEQTGNIEVHFGGELEGHLFKYGFGITPSLEQRLFPSFLYSSSLSKIAQVLKFFNSNLLDLKNEHQKEIIFSFPSKLFTQSVYYLLANHGFSIVLLDPVSNTIKVTHDRNIIPSRKVISNTKVHDSTVLYSIHLKQEKPFFIGYGYTVFPSS